MIAPDPAPAAARPSAARPEGLPAEAPHRDRPESGAATDFGAVVAERPAKRGPPDERRADVEPPDAVPVPLLSAQASPPLPANAVQVIAPIAATPDLPPSREAGIAVPAPQRAAPPSLPGSEAPALPPTAAPVAPGVPEAIAAEVPPAVTEAVARANGRVEARPAPAMPPAAPVSAPVPVVAEAARARSARETEEATVETAAAPERATGPAAPAGPQAAPPAGPMPAAIGPEAYRLVLHETAGASWSLAPEPAGGHRQLEPAAQTPPQAAPAAPQAVIAQIAVAVGRSSERSVEIRLDPPELGRVQIHLTPTDGRLQALVIAERPETQDLLRRHAEVLVRELGGAGYDSVSLDFAPGGEAPAGRQPAPLGLGAEIAAIAAPAEPVPVAAAPRTLTGGLDVRL